MKKVLLLVILISIQLFPQTAPSNYAGKGSVLEGNLSFF